MFQGACATAALALAGPFCAAAAEQTKIKPIRIKYLKNSDFYGKDGKFNADHAKQAYFHMMKGFHYPIFERLKGKDMWVTDFGLGDFTRVGMGGIFWWNDKANGYFGHEIYLLPGQMIVEHAHEQAGDVKPKMEAWQVRHGMIFNFSVGEPTNPLPVELPQSQAKFITCQHCEIVKPGEVASLKQPGAKHFMLAGPEGTIVTEYATYHDNAALRFTNPGVKF